MQTFLFTVATLDALPVPERGRARYKDTKRSNLVLYVTPTARTFYMVARRDGRLYEERIGAFPTYKIEEARRKVDELLGAIERGEDPRTVGGRRRKGETFGELFTWWLESHAKVSLKPRTWRAAETLYARDLARHIGNRPVVSITRADIAELHAKVRADIIARGRHGDGNRYNGLHSANDAVSTVGRVIRHAILMERYNGPDPTVGTPRKGEEPRDRVLQPHEVGPLFRALGNAPPRVADFVKLCLWTGARSGNVLAMRWEDVDFEARVWRIPETKSGKRHLVLLEDEELALLKARHAALAGQGAPWVFPARHSRFPDRKAGHLVEPHPAWRKILADAGIEDLRIHDLRRTHGSWMLQHGAPIKTISAALGHADSRVTERVYAHLVTQDPVREAKRAALAAIAKAAKAKPSARSNRGN